MSGYYDDLLKEGAKLAKNHKKTKHTNKIFSRLVVAVLVTCIICYCFSKLNSIFNFYNNFVMSILVLVIFIATLTATAFNGRKKETSLMLAVYMFFVALRFIPYFDFSNLLEIAIQLLITFVIFFVLTITNKLSEKYYIIPTILVGISIFALDLLKVINCSSIILMEIIIFVTSYILRKINELTKNPDEEFEKLENRLNGHLVFVYTLFMCAYSIMI